MRIFLALIFCWIVVLGEAQTLSPKQFKSTDFQRLEANKVDNGSLFQAYLGQAELFLADDKFGEAQEVLAKAAVLKAPNSDWYLLLAKSHAGLGQQAEMMKTLRDGQKMYPFSAALGATLSLQMIADAAPANFAQLQELPLPKVGKEMATAVWCYTHKEPVEGMLQTLKAYYSGGQNRLPVEVLAGFDEASKQVFSGSLDEKYEGAIVGNELAEVYGRSLVVAAKALRQDSTAGVRCEGNLRELVCLHKAALRHFADRSGLSRFPDPLLVDLYLLDKAGYLDWAYYELFAPLYPKEYVALQKEFPAKAAAAKTYIGGQWANDVAAWLSRVEE